jgi:deoxyadenosine/deoxycytidine kinase
MTTQPLILSIEGNIGTGKSTFLDKLKIQYKDNERICFLDEPVDIWVTITDKKGVNIIEKYYDNQKRYAFSFQMMAFISRLTSLRKALASKKYDVIVMERSLYTDCHVFAKMLYDDKKIEDIEYAIYMKWFNDFNDEFPPITFIYLKTEPIISFKRVEKRNRQGEIIPLSYLKNCNDYHDSWLLNENKLPVVILDANIDIVDNPEIIHDWVKSVDNIISRNNRNNIVRYNWMDVFNISYYL